MLFVPLGGCRERGRNCFLITWDSHQLLLDCGVSPSYAKETPNAYPHLERISIDKLDAIILSHAHEDHFGMIPKLYEMGYEGEVYATKPTAQIMKNTCKQWLSTLTDASAPKPYTEDSLDSLRPCGLDYEEENSITPGTSFFLSPSGHMLGSAIVN